MFQMALAAGMTANNVTVDPRDIALLNCSYHIVELSTTSGLLVCLLYAVNAEHHRNASYDALSENQ